MLLDGVYSKLGRATQMELAALRRMLSVGTDPAYDYSKEIESSKTLLMNAAKRSKSTTDIKNDAADKVPDAVGPLADLGTALGTWRDENQLKTEVKDSNQVQVGAARRQKQLRPTWAFAAQNWQDIARHEDHMFDQPACPNLRVKEECTQRRVMVSSFGLRPKNVGLKTKELMKKIEELKEAGKLLSAANLLKHSISVDYLPTMPIRGRRKVVVPDFKHLGGHKNPDDLCDIVFNINSFDGNMRNIDKLNGEYGRSPQWDFRATQGHEPPAQESYFVPGQYRCQYNAVRRRDDKSGVAWNRRIAGLPFEKTGSQQRFVPDRSLCRTCSAIEPRILVPDMSKGVPRPVPGNKIVSEVSMKPEFQEAVTRQRMEYDANKAEKFMLKRDCIPDFNKFLRREDSMVGSRVYGEDRALQQARHVPPVLSVERLPLERLDTPAVYPRVGTSIDDFNLQRGRDEGIRPARECDKPSRKHDQIKEVSKFSRSPRRGESGCPVRRMSAITDSVASLRKCRAYFPVTE
eukprot:GEMP01035031.1.p1 GENE.GEMP01035031.1~~GEMP01035031.1.p1  ORF type:complete len:518 (+),score=102.46 GEMP01035031.1:110-1663(+)